MAKKMFLIRERGNPTVQVTSVSREDPDSEIASYIRNNRGVGESNTTTLYDFGKEV